jgi:peroxiredoxin
VAEKDYLSLPDDLPVPEDDGAADHLTGARVPEWMGDARLLVVYIYPRTGVPGQPLIEGWDDIPGARGCTPQSCAFRDLQGEIEATGARVVGLSAMRPDETREFAERVGIEYELIADPELRLADDLRLPTFEAGGLTLYKRLTFVARDGVIEKVFYPVFPPDRNASEVLAWLS